MVSVGAAHYVGRYGGKEEGEREDLVRDEGEARFSALLRIGWQIKRESGSHRTLARAGWQDVTFAFHDKEEIGPAMLKRIAKDTGLKPEDL